MKFSLVILFILVFSSSTFSQEQTPKKFQTGFSISSNYSFLQARGSKAKELNLQPGIGIGLGILCEYHLTTRLTVSGRIGLSFNSTQLNYRNGQGDLMISTPVYKQNLEASLLGQFQLSSKYKRPYLLLGPTIYTPLQKIKNPTEVVIPQTTIAIDLGIGFDVPLKNFRFAPELRYSYGINNMVISPLLHQLYYHRLTLALNFKE